MRARTASPIRGHRFAATSAAGGTVDACNIEDIPFPSEIAMSNTEQHRSKDEQKSKTLSDADAGVERAHVERQPVPGHPENIPTDAGMRRPADGDATPGPVAGPVAGPVDEEEPAPSAEPSTKPGTPPGTQSERDRSRGSS
jgi:hypothetical protein